MAMVMPIQNQANKMWKFKINKFFVLRSTEFYKQQMIDYGIKSQTYTEKSIKINNINILLSKKAVKLSIILKA